MVTPDQNQMNLHEAASQAAEETGLTDLPKSAWTLAQRKDYLDAFRAIVLQAQDNFLPQTVAIANRIDTSSYIYDFSADADLAVANSVLSAAAAVGAPMAAANGIVDALQGVGQGLSHVGQLAPLLLPLAVVVGLFIFTQSGAKKLERVAAF